jgi:putative addiction module component (TIGR02574 family)
MMIQELGLTHLTPRQRRLLADELMESVEDVDSLPPIVAGQFLTQAKIDELERRIAEHEKNPDDAMDAFEFMELMKKKHGL